MNGTKGSMIVLAALLAISPALADRGIEETVAASADGEVSIELISGDLRVIGWDRAEVQVSGTVGDDVESVEVTSHGGRVSIEVELVDDSSNRRSYKDADADLEIHVPASSMLEVETISADIKIEGIRGDVELESISGKIEVVGAVGEAEVSTVSGNIGVTSSAPLKEGSFESVSGDIEVRAALGSGDFSFETVSGSVELRLPANTSAEFEVETFSGSIKNAFGPEAERASEYAPGKELRFTTGGGDARVEVESFSGTVEIAVD